MASPEEVVTRHRQVKRYRRGRAVPVPSHAGGTDAPIAVHPVSDATEGRTRAPSGRPSFRSMRTWVTVAGALAVLLGTAITTGYVAMKSDPAFGSPEQLTPVRPAPRPAPGRIGPPVFIPSRASGTAPAP
ncbi:MAG TPA: hypothetical protein VGR06_09795 [Actinophytocola sp.]|jgi:hypothetical protein|uniref:hypothetical protein n=1 Tax=Actinophytocola sp. TaxID=1872138 RepID=UPI002E0A0C66|nr:hypothetical protein [Actinophytocola sp.]